MADQDSPPDAFLYTDPSKTRVHTTQPSPSVFTPEQAGHFAPRQQYGFEQQQQQQQAILQSQQMMSTIINSNIVFPANSLGSDPEELKCKHCHEKVVTKTTYEFGNYARQWLFCLIFSL
ncbi:cell death-inducing p53-target protein 1 homolog [Aplysia californica]|uniref:Cell death-inducing p53-target protein 1 homolog n=1 Tax=Aplysia californica TaxID=6500 RepID=A0ABM0JRI9_APLCA|nr:cell death-inducing p53-target protein 1 homolog [Aplysia californica]